MPRSCLAVVLACCSFSAGAAPILSSDGYVSFRKLSEPGNSQIFCDASGGASVACAGSGALRDLPDMELTFSTSASVGMGVLKSFASGSLSGTGVEAENSLAIIRADAWFRDQITFFGLPAGTPGSITFSFGLSGSIWGSDLANLNPGLPFQDTNGAGWSITARRYVAGGGSTNTSASGYEPPDFVNLTLPVSFGQPEAISFILGALVNLRALEDGSNATADFGSTAVLIGMSAYDLNGRPVSSFYATGSEDSSYLNVGPAIPEPGTWASAACGLLVLLWRCRARRPC